MMGLYCTHVVLLYCLFIYVQVTAVGMNTEWGILMASISEDNGEETPLQVLITCVHVMCFNAKDNYTRIRFNDSRSASLDRCD